MNKRIAYILTTYPCGSETFIRNEVSQLKEKGLDIVIFAAKTDGRCEVIPGIDVYYRPGLFSFKAFQAALSFLVSRPLAFCRVILSILIYVFHHPYEGLSLAKNLSSICYFSALFQKLGLSHVHAGFMNWPARIGYVLSKALNCSYSLAVHARDGYVEGGAIGLKVENAEFVLCCTQTMASHVVSKVKLSAQQKIHTIYHGVSIEQSSQIHSASCQVPTLIAIGRFVKKKGLGCLLSAFGEVIKECSSDVHLVLVGDGSERRRLEDYVKKLDIEKNVSFAGWLNHEQTLLKLSQSALLVVPSVVSDDKDRDGIPNVILEAFMLKVPVIASGLESIKEAVVDGHSGLLVEPGNILQLKNAIVQLLKDQSLRRRIVENAWENCNKQFNSLTNIEKVYPLFCMLNL